MLSRLEAGEGPSESSRGAARPQLEMFVSRPPTPSPVESTLRELDIEQITPVQALLTLSQLKALLS